MKNNNLEQITMNLICEAKSDEEKVKRIFYFVRDEIKFDFVKDQFISSQQVLNAKKGVCMHKALVLHDMVQIAGISARLHFMKVDKKALEDLLPPIIYKKYPQTFLHTYPEINIDGKWVPMEATFDKELHEILLKKELNFGKYENRKNISIEFNKNGVIGAQQHVVIQGTKPIYANNLNPLKESMKELSKLKLLIQPLAFEISSKWINDKIRA